MPYILISIVLFGYRYVYSIKIRKSIKCYGNGNLGHTMKVYLTFMILFELQSHFGVRNNTSNFYSY